jgi:hypothetical protein
MVDSDAAPVTTLGVSPLTKPVIEAVKGARLPPKAMVWLSAATRSTALLTTRLTVFVAAR